MKVYLSHTIRGKYGSDATCVQMEANCERAIEVGEQIRAAVPSIDLYIPAESERFVQIAYKRGFLSENEILIIDCVIIDTCDMVVIHDSEGDVLQGGRLVEYNHAVEFDIPRYIFREPGQVINWITKQILRA